MFAEPSFTFRTHNCLAGFASSIPITFTFASVEIDFTTMLTHSTTAVTKIVLAGLGAQAAWFPKFVWCSVVILTF